MPSLTDQERLELDQWLAKHIFGWEFSAPGRYCCSRCGRPDDDCRDDFDCHISETASRLQPILEWVDREHQYYCNLELYKGQWKLNLYSHHEPLYDWGKGSKYDNPLDAVCMTVRAFVVLSGFDEPDEVEETPIPIIEEDD